MNRILAIDGGGLRGAIPASFLAEVEERIGDRVAGYFDLVVGTSTGGLIALGLGLGLPAREILRLYETWGPKIFARRRRLLPLGLSAPMYDLERLREALEAVFGGASLASARRRLLIPAFDAAEGRVHLWRAYPGTGLVDDVSVVDVALSTSAAPVYFQAHRTAAGTPMLDGGVFANCPVMLAVADAAACLGWRPEEMRILSLGCAIAPFRAGDGAVSGAAGSSGILRGGMLQWGVRLPELFVTAQEDAALVMARSICGTANVLRVNPVDPGGNAVDNPADLPRFRALGEGAAALAFPHLEPVFFREKAEPVATPHSTGATPRPPRAGSA